MLLAQKVLQDDHQVSDSGSEMEFAFATSPDGLSNMTEDVARFGTHNVDEILFIFFGEWLERTTLMMLLIVMMMQVSLNARSDIIFSDIVCC